MSMTRLSEIVELTKNYRHSIVCFYDLFCDHGKVGQALLGKDKQVYFNDKRVHLIESLKEVNRPQGENCHYLIKDAQDITFQENSFIIAAGVGGLLMIECFEKWQRLHAKELFDSLTFLTCPTYYDSELREYLKNKNYFVGEEKLCLDRGRIYDMQVISSRPIGPKVSLIPSQENLPNYLKFRERKLKNLKDKVDKNNQDLFLIEELEK